MYILFRCLFVFSHGIAWLSVCMSKSDLYPPGHSPAAQNLKAVHEYPQRAHHSKQPRPSAASLRLAYATGCCGGCLPSSSDCLRVAALTSPLASVVSTAAWRLKCPLDYGRHLALTG